MDGKNHTAPPLHRGSGVPHPTTSRSLLQTVATRRLKFAVDLSSGHCAHRGPAQTQLSALVRTFGYDYLRKANLLVRRTDGARMSALPPSLSWTTNAFPIIQPPSLLINKGRCSPLSLHLPSYPSRRRVRGEGGHLQNFHQGPCCRGILAFVRGASCFGVGFCAGPLAERRGHGFLCALASFCPCCVGPSVVDQNSRRPTVLIRWDTQCRVLNLPARRFRVQGWLIQYLLEREKHFPHTIMKMVLPRGILGLNSTFRPEFYL